MKYLYELKKAIWQVHGCEATHAATVPVREVVHGQIAWEGDVEVFNIPEHPKAKRCYAWGNPAWDDAKNRKITTVLEVPPVVSAETAVQASIAAESKRRN